MILNQIRLILRYWAYQNAFIYKSSKKNQDYELVKHYYECTVNAWNHMNPWAKTVTSIGSKFFTFFTHLYIGIFH